jgi:hypothetical protein
MNNIVDPKPRNQCGENQDISFDELEKLLALVEDDVPTDLQQILDTLFSAEK